MAKTMAPLKQVRSVSGEGSKKATWWWWQSLKPHLFHSFCHINCTTILTFFDRTPQLPMPPFILSPLVSTVKMCLLTPIKPLLQIFCWSREEREKEGIMKRSGKVGIKSDECFNSHLAPGWKLLCLIPSLTIHLELQNCFRVGERGCLQS